MRLPQDRILHIDTELKDGKVNVVAEWQGELVRCKDCEHWDAADGECYGYDHFHCSEENDYCSHGQTKEQTEYKLPGHDEVMEALDKLTIKQGGNDHE